jgi:hypothetical protein
MYRIVTTEVPYKKRASQRKYVKIRMIKIEFWANRHCKTKPKRAKGQPKGGRMKPVGLPFKRRRNEISCLGYTEKACGGSQQFIRLM